MRLAVLIVVAVFAASIFGARVSISDDELLNIRLKTAPTAVSRLALLSDDQFVFDTNPFRNGEDMHHPGVSIGDGGRTINAFAGNFPAIIGHGISMTLGIIEPCGINLPHTHPRATEILISVSGTFRAGFIAENGARYIGNNISDGMLTIFPQGSVHFEQNEGCEPAIFVAAFNNEDPGVQTTSHSYFGLPSDIAATGFLDFNASQVQELTLNLARNPAFGVEECRVRCGLSKGRGDAFAFTTPQNSNGSSQLPYVTALVVTVILGVLGL